jgi:hypothetical protein
MSENNLFHFAQVVSEMPAQPHSTQDLPRAEDATVLRIRQVQVSVSVHFNLIVCNHQSLESHIILE